MIQNALDGFVEFQLFPALRMGLLDDPVEFGKQGHSGANHADIQ